jgi:hypothetical protein
VRYQLADTQTAKWFFADKSVVTHNKGSTSKKAHVTLCYEMYITSALTNANVYSVKRYNNKPTKKGVYILLVSLALLVIFTGM